MASELLVIGHHHLDARRVLVHDHLGHLGGLQRVDEEGRDVVRPRMMSIFSP
jgi:hypothetical protein